MRSLVIAILLYISLTACRERYGLPLEASRENLLVVEGNILNGDTTKIQVSRTSRIAERQLIPESGASLQIEGDDNSVYPLIESEPGLYKSNFLILNNANRYRLRIMTGSNVYESEWLEVISTPEIDSVIWKRDNGVEISILSHGTDDDSRYFKWDYDEVWEFHPEYESWGYFTYVIDSNGIKRYQCIDVTRDGVTFNTCIEAYLPPDGKMMKDSLYYCWKYVSSSNINIGSTAALADNTVFAPVRKIEDNAWELSFLYSILVKQTGLSRDGYEFYKILKANSEGLGSIFDAQPSQMKTNLKCVTNPDETVIGFVDATTVKNKRIFISVKQLPDWRYFDEYNCTDTLTEQDLPYDEYVARNMVPVKVVTESNSPYRVTFYTMTTRPCADCRVRGVHIKPDFWP
jgi:hypothetical protein